MSDRDTLLRKVTFVRTLYNKYIKKPNSNFLYIFIFSSEVMTRVISGKVVNKGGIVILKGGIIPLTTNLLNLLRF